MHDDLLAHGGFLRALARSLVTDGQAADDVVQDTWVRSLERPPRAPSRPWLARVARNVVRMDGREGARRRVREARAARVEGSGGTAPDGRALLRELMEAVLALDEPYQTAVLLRYYEGLPPRAIASRLGVSVEAVKGRLKRGLAELRRRFDEGPRARAWRGELALVVGLAAPAPAAAGAGAASLTGAMMMTAKTKISLAAVLVFGLVAGGLALLGGGAPSDGARLVEPAGGAAADAADAGTPPASRERQPDAPVEPVPFAEPEAPAAGAAPGGEPRAVIEVLRDDGAPAARACVVLFEDDAVLAQAVTGDDGRAHVPRRWSTVRAAVRWPRAPVYATTLELSDEPARVRLPPGEELAGTVVLDATGAPPDEPLRVEIVTVWSESALELPDAVSRALVPQSRQDRRMHCRVGPDGAFAFRGLPATWNGFLFLSRGWRFSGVPGYLSRSGGGETADVRGHERVEVVHPRTDLVVRVTRLPRITGRVVIPEGEPASDVYVECAFSGPRSSLLSMWSVDDEGRFTVVVSQASFTRAELSFRRRDSAGEATRLIDEDLQRDHDLGDVRLAAGREVHFVVREPGGRPVAGAIAIAGRLRSGPTDAEGRGRLVVDPDADAFSVGALGFGVTRADVPTPGSDPVDVTLHPVNRLEVRVSVAGGASPEGLRLELSGRDPLLAYDARATFGTSPVHGAVGASEVHQGSKDATTCRMLFRPVAPGRWTVMGLVPGATVTATLLDDYGSRLRRQEVVLGATDVREIDWRLGSGPRDVHGVVRDARGRAIMGASVRIDRGDNSTTGVTTAADGTFRIPDVWGDRLSLVVRKRGYQTERLPDHRLPPDGEPLEVVLREGLRVVVHVADEEGRPLPSAHVFAETGEEEDEGYAGRLLEGGAFELRDLPDRPLRLTVRVAGRAYERPLDPTSREAHVVVPVHGKVVVVLEGPMPEGGGVVARLDPAGGAGAAVHEHLEGRRTTFPCVLPGRYEAYLSRWSRDHGWIPIGPRRPLEVRAGATTRVQLGR